MTYGLPISLAAQKAGKDFRPGRF